MQEVRKYLLLMGLLVLGACGGGTESAAPPAPVDAPVIQSFTKQVEQAGTIIFSFQYTDSDNAQLALSLQYSLDDGLSWQTDAATTNPVLTASSATQTGNVSWQYAPAIGFHDGLVRLSLSDGTNTTVSASIAVSGQATLRSKAASADSYMIYYGALNDQIIAQARNYRLAIVHPFQGNITAAQVRAIQRGNNLFDPADDVMVLCYISIGEDIRTFGLSDEQMLNDPRNRFVGDGSGPVTDPRGSAASGNSLTGLDVKGVASSGGTGFAPFYLDDNNYDGSPDRNGNFDVAFVNAGHPAWFDVIDAMTFAADGIPGLKEMLSHDTTDNKRGLGCDGLFLDTLDTAAPNSFTDSSSANQSEFEWTAGGFYKFLERLRATYPEKLILQNRGLFFFNSVFKHYEFNTRPLIDFVLYESYRLDSSSQQTFHPYFHTDNKYNFRPRLMAEAQRGDGFTVLSLGYAEGPPGEMETETLDDTTGAGIGYNLLIEDIVESENLSGFRHYLTDEAIIHVNDFVRLNAQRTDTDPPVWNSTYNAYIQPFPQPASAPDPRVGIQQAAAGSALGEVIVRWDIALDYNPVTYVLYYQTTPFDFVNDPQLSGAVSVELNGRPGAGYERGPSASVYANEASIAGLTENQTYYFAIRARDAAGNIDTNQVSLDAVPASTPRQYAIQIDGDFADWSAVPPAYRDIADAIGSNGPDWLEIKLANDDNQLYVYSAYALNYAPDGHYNIYIDADNSAATGFLSGSLSTLGADFLIQNGNLYSMATGTNFVTSWVAALTSGPLGSAGALELTVPLSLLGLTNAGQTLGMVFVNDGTPEDFAPEIGSTIQFTLAPP